MNSIFTVGCLFAALQCTSAANVCSTTASNASNVANKAKDIIKKSACLIDSQANAVGVYSKQYNSYKASLSKDKCKQKVILFPKVPVSCCTSAASGASSAANNAKALIKGSVCLTDSQIKSVGTLTQQYNAHKNAIRNNKCRQAVIPFLKIPASCCSVALSGMNKEISKIRVVTKGKQCVNSLDAKRISSYAGSYNKFKKDLTAMKCTQVVPSLPAIPRACTLPPPARRMSPPVAGTPAPQIISTMQPPVFAAPPPPAVTDFSPFSTTPPPPYFHTGLNTSYSAHSHSAYDHQVTTTVTSNSGVPVLTVSFSTDAAVTLVLPDGTELPALSLLQLSGFFFNDSSIKYINTAAIFITTQIVSAMATHRIRLLRKLLDNPGCDNYPDTACTIPCCALHDKCYHDHNCTYSSWIFDQGSACSKCNSDVADCVSYSSTYLTCDQCEGKTPIGKSCYDHQCDAYYDCPGKCPCYSSAPSDGCCECKSPCQTPAPTSAPTPAPTPEPTPEPERGCGGPQDPGGLPCVPTPEPTVAPTPAQACKPQFYNNYWFTINGPSNPVTCPFICDPTREGGGVCVSIDINMCDGTVIKDACNFVQHVQPYLDPNVCYYDPCTGKHVPKP